MLYEQLESKLLKNYHSIYHPILKEEAILHSGSVAMFARLVALQKGFSSYEAELAAIAGLFHDCARYLENCPARFHAQQSAARCLPYLKEAGIDEQGYHLIEKAISYHSNKQKEDSSFDEVLKLADLLATGLRNPDSIDLSKVSESLAASYHQWYPYTSCSKVR